MNQFLSTFTCKVFLYVMVIIQIKECSTTGLYYMCCHIHKQVKPGARIFCWVYGNYINVSTLVPLTDTLDSYLLMLITINSVLSSFNIKLSLIIHEWTSVVQRLETKKNRFPPLKEKSIVIASTGSFQYFGCHGKSKKKIRIYIWCRSCKCGNLWWFCGTS